MPPSPALKAADFEAARPAASELAQLLQSKHCKHSKHMLAQAARSWDFLESSVHIGPLCTAEPAGKISLLLTQLKLQRRGCARSTYPAHVKARQDIRGGCIRPMLAHIISAVSASGISCMRGVCYVVLPACAAGRTAMYLWVRSRKGGAVRQVYSGPCVYSTQRKSWTSFVTADGKSFHCEQDLFTPLMY